MSKLLSSTVLDTDSEIWEQAIHEAKAKIAKLQCSIKIFRENIRLGVKVPRGQKS